MKIAVPPSVLSPTTLEFCRRKGAFLLIFYRYPDRRSYDYFAFSRSDKGHCIQLCRIEQTEDEHDLILPVSMNPTLKIPVDTPETIPLLQQHRPFFEVNEHGMSLDLPHDDDPSKDHRVYQLAQYTGTLATLEQIAGMYVCDPPCQRAMMHVTISCETIEGSAIPGRLIGQLYYIFFESSTGLKMADVLKALSLEPSRSYRLMRSPYLGIHPDCYRDMGAHKGWDDGLTVTKLQSVLQEYFRPMHMHLNPVIEIGIRLLDTDGGLRSIVPTAVERSAVVDRRVSPALRSTRYGIH